MGASTSSGAVPSTTEAEEEEEAAREAEEESAGAHILTPVGAQSAAEAEGVNPPINRGSAKAVLASRRR